MSIQLEQFADDDRRIPNEKQLTSCMSINSPFSPPESVSTSRSTSKGFLSMSTVGPGDNLKLRIGRVTVGSLKTNEGGLPGSRLSGCPLTLSDGSARECWITLDIFVRLGVLALSEVCLLCNMCDDRVVTGGMFATTGVGLGWRLLEDEAQTLSSQSSRITSGTVPGTEGEVIHERTELV